MRGKIEDAALIGPRGGKHWGAWSENKSPDQKLANIQEIGKDTRHTKKVIGRNTKEGVLDKDGRCGRGRQEQEKKRCSEDSR